MQRFPSIMRDYRAGGAGAAPAGGSYRGNRTSGEVPQWLVDTCNEDNEYEEDYEHASHVVRDNSHDANFPVHVGAYQGSAYDSVQYGEDEYGDHSSDVSYRRASRKSSLDTVDTLRRDNTRGGTSYRQQFEDDNDSSYRQQFQDDNGPSHNFDDGDVDVGKQQSYMSEPYEYQERSQVEDEDYQSIPDTNGPDYYFPHHQEGTSSHRQEQAHAPRFRPAAAGSATAKVPALPGLALLMRPRPSRTFLQAPPPRPTLDRLRHRFRGWSQS